jgi:hypothetical protein
VSRSRIVLAVVASVVVLGAARQIVQGERAISACDAAIVRGDAREAIAQARLAAESALPGSPYPARGYERLGGIAHEAEARGDVPTAAAAWRAVRAAAMETRAFGSGSAARIRDANEGLVRAARGEDRAAASRERALGDALAREDGPTSLEILLLAIAAAALYVVGSRLLRPRPR